MWQLEPSTPLIKEIKISCGDSTVHLVSVVQLLRSVRDYRMLLECKMPDIGHLLTYSFVFLQFQSGARNSPGIVWVYVALCAFAQSYEAKLKF